MQKSQNDTNIHEVTPQANLRVSWTMPLNLSTLSLLSSKAQAKIF